MDWRDRIIPREGSIVDGRLENWIRAAIRSKQKSRLIKLPGTAAATASKRRKDFTNSPGPRVRGPESSSGLMCLGTTYGKSSERLDIVVCERLTAVSCLAGPRLEQAGLSAK